MICLKRIICYLLILVTFLLPSCTTSIKRTNHQSDIKAAKAVCDSFLVDLQNDKYKAFNYFAGVRQSDFFKVIFKSDSLFGNIVSYNYINGESLVENKNGVSFSSYEIKYELKRSVKTITQTFYLESISGKIKIVGSRENFDE